MRIAISGASGLVGRAVSRALEARGDEVVRLVRRREQVGKGAAFWDPERGELDEAGLGTIDAIVHLAGENVGARRWTPEVRERILQSRVRGTSLLAGAAARVGARTIASASGVGYYGDCGEDVVDETHPPGTSFIAEVSVAWERALDEARQAGVRCVPMRIAPVVARESELVAKMVRPFRFGVGGKIASGKQWASFVALEDLVAIALRALDDPAIGGPLNAVSPEPVRNEELTRILARLLRRPAIFPVPAFAVRLAIGELAGEVLASCRAVPKALLDRGFEFAYPTIEAMFRHALAEPTAPEAAAR